MKPRVVICGSFHRDPLELKRLFRELEATGCRILSPISLDFTNTNDEIVLSKNEFDLNIEELEKFHLRAIRDADLVWLHAPDGYVGNSATYEIGYSDALNKPVYCYCKPKDQMLSSRTRLVLSVFEALELENLI